MLRSSIPSQLYQSSAAQLLTSTRAYRMCSELSLPLYSWMMKGARQDRPHLQVLHRHMTGALIVPQPIAVESIDLHSLHPMLFHPLLLLALRCHFATSLISACPQPQQHSPCEHDDTLHGKRTFLTLSSKRTKGAAFVPQLRVVLHPFLTFIRRAMLRSGRQTQIDVQSNMKVLQTL